MFILCCCCWNFSYSKDSDAKNKKKMTKNSTHLFSSILNSKIRITRQRAKNKNPIKKRKFLLINLYSLLLSYEFFSPQNSTSNIFGLLIFGRYIHIVRSHVYIVCTFMWSNSQWHHLWAANVRYIHKHLNRADRNIW